MRRSGIRRGAPVGSKRLAIGSLFEAGAVAAGIGLEVAARTIEDGRMTSVPPVEKSSTARGVIPTAVAIVAPRLFVRSAHTGSVAGLLGWPVLLTSLISMLGFRKQLRKTRLLAMLALVGLLAGVSMTLTGCSSKSMGAALPPTGAYNVKLNMTGPNGVSASTPITFTVTTGVAGQL